MESALFITTKDRKAHPRWEDRAELLPEDLPCPFYNREKQSCRAEKNESPVAAARLQLCNSDEHDRCPTYLAYLLRRSRPLRSDCDWLDVV